jgi:hypothetical protein
MSSFEKKITLFLQLNPENLSHPGYHDRKRTKIIQSSSVFQLTFLPIIVETLLGLHTLPVAGLFMVEPQKVEHAVNEEPFDFAGIGYLVASRLDFSPLKRDINLAYQAAFIIIEREHIRGIRLSPEAGIEFPDKKIRAQNNVHRLVSGDFFPFVDQPRDGAKPASGKRERRAGMKKDYGDTGMFVFLAHFSIFAKKKD